MTTLVQTSNDIFEDLTNKLWTSKDLPNELYHYTTVEGGRSIITNCKRFWASSFETMNDNEELIKGLESAKDLVKSELKKVFDDSAAKDSGSKWENFLEEEKKSPRARPYIISFTESPSNDHLWCKYGDCSKGVALELTKVCELANNVNGMWIKVNYDKVSWKADFENHLSQATTLFLEHCSNLVAGAIQLDNYFQALIQICFFYAISLKDSKWSAEKEWRLVIFHPSKPSSKHRTVKHRTRDSKLIDYLVVDPKDCGYSVSGVKAGAEFPKESSFALDELLRQNALK